jgi:TolB protein
MKQQTRRYLTVWVWALFVLAACGPKGQAAQPTPGFLPVEASNSLVADTPAATVSVQDIALPGRIAFVKQGNVWLWQGSTGSEFTRQGDLFQPSWSPDGTRLACVQRGESYSDIVMLSMPDGEMLRLTNDGSNLPSQSFERMYDTIWAFYPSFSPDGTQIAFASQAGPPAGSPASEYNLSLFVTQAAVGGDAEQVYASDEGHVGRVVYSPDGSIVFGFTPSTAESPRLLRYTESATPLPGVPEKSYDPAFSADGAWLAFASRDAGRTDLFAVPANGGSPVRLTNMGTARAPAFSPDGAWMAFLAIAPGAQGFDLWVADITNEGDGLRIGQPRQLTQGLHIDVDSGLSWGR